MKEKKPLLDLALAILRLALGSIFIAHGAQKWFGVWGGHGWSATLAAFEEHLGIPPILGAVAIVTEFCGGIAVVAGALTRLSSLGLAVTMVVAIAKVHWAGGFFMKTSAQALETGAHGIEYNVALLAMSLALVFAGGGQWALDPWIFGGWKRRA